MSTAGQPIAIRQIAFFGGGSILRTPRWQCWRSASGTWPLARLTIRDDGLELRVVWQRVWFPREEVRHLAIRKGLLGDGIQIVPAAEESEDCFLFWPLRLERLLPYLLAFRYPVALG
jgi:hypothetical protein